MESAAQQLPAPPAQHLGALTQKHLHLPTGTLILWGWGERRGAGQPLRQGQAWVGKCEEVMTSSEKARLQPQAALGELRVLPCFQPHPHSLLCPPPGSTLSSPSAVYGCHLAWQRLR